MPQNNSLEVSGKFKKDGIAIIVNGKEYCVSYPQEIWDATPESVKKLMLDNLTFSNTHFLGVSLNKDTVDYKTTDFPLLESFWFRNQMNDMFDCETLDNTKPLTYLQRLYNLNYTFAHIESAFPKVDELKDIKTSEKVAVIPFTFGLESLTTTALCMEMGITPILVYCQEPSQPFEEEVKKKLLKEFSEKYNVKTFFLENGPAAFRYNHAFPDLPETEVGWGAETTIFLIMMLPFVLYFGAGYVFSGSEFINNDYFINKEGWKVFLSADETSFFSVNKNNMLKIATLDKAKFKTTFEPIEKVNVFHLLYKRYPEMAKYQFSCHARKPLVEGTHWCHVCDKCVRNYMLATVLGVDTYEMGFREDLLQKPGLEHCYFEDAEDVTYYNYDNFLMYLLTKNGYKSPYLDLFEKRVAEGKIRLEGTLEEYVNYFTSMHTSGNLPADYRNQMTKIFTEDMGNMKKYITEHYKIA